MKRTSRWLDINGSLAAFVEHDDLVKLSVTTKSITLWSIKPDSFMTIIVNNFNEWQTADKTDIIIKIYG